VALPKDSDIVAVILLQRYCCSDIVAAILLQSYCCSDIVAVRHFRRTISPTGMSHREGGGDRDREAPSRYA